MGRHLLVLLTVALFAPATRGQDRLSNWSDMVTHTQAEQPAWTTPLVTSSAKLDQRVRYDVIHSQTSSGDVWNFGNSKGVDLIVAPRTEIVVAPPAYFSHQNPALRDGFGDWNFQLKYRLRSRTEEGGNYIVTAYVSTTVPTGSYRNGVAAAVITPSLAVGKGWLRSRTVWQNTAGLALPAGETARLGRPLQVNSAIQCRVHRYFWPELEANSTFFLGGASDGKKQVFLTPGLICGRIPLHRRVGLTVGAGIQIAATTYHTSNHAVITSVRTSF